MYGGKIRLTYLDQPHMYYAQNRLSFDIPETSDKAWGKKWRPKGTTTLLGDTLEKKGLMTWPMGVALRELFGFYDFEPEPGKKLTGFSRDKGTIWNANMTPDELLPLVLSASRAWQRQQKTGADIGSLVHDAIEQFTLGSPIELTLERYESGQVFESNAQRLEWHKTAQGEIAQAMLAYERFKLWWAETKPKLLSAEQIVYSKKYDYSGAYDALLVIDGKIVLVDYKTSNASVSAGAPQGVYYSYFIQSAAYALAMLEMNAVNKIDDLMIISARKDGSFSTITASEVGLSVEEAIDWWKAVVTCYRQMDKVKRQLVTLGANNVKV